MSLDAPTGTISVKLPNKFSNALYPLLIDVFNELQNGSCNLTVQRHITFLSFLNQSHSQNEFHQINK